VLLSWIVGSRINSKYIKYMMVLTENDERGGWEHCKLETNMFVHNVGGEW
jgi:hypothetical protein